MSASEAFAGLGQAPRGLCTGLNWIVNNRLKKSRSRPDRHQRLDDLEVLLAMNVDARDLVLDDRNDSSAHVLGAARNPAGMAEYMKVERDICDGKFGSQHDRSARIPIRQQRLQISLGSDDVQARL